MKVSIIFLITVCIATCVVAYNPSSNNNIKSLYASRELLCNASLFNLTWFPLDVIKPTELQITFFLQLNMPISVPPNVLRDHVTKCLNYIYVNGKPSNLTQQEINKIVYITLDDKLDGIMVQFENLPPLVKYVFTIGYSQVVSPNSTLNVSTSVSKTLNSCYGPPDKPRNVQKSLQYNGDITVTWDEPAVVRAPKLCYYKVEKYVNSVMSGVFNITNPRSYTVSRSEGLSKTELRISAYNAAECYEKEFSFVKNCTNIESSGVVSLWLNSTVLPDTTKMPNSAFINRPTSVLYSFFIYFLIFISL